LGASWPGRRLSSRFDVIAAAANAACGNKACIARHIVETLRMLFAAAEN
jgi:hypothetical protein